MFPLGVSIFPQISGSYGLRPVVAAPCPHVRVRGLFPSLSFPFPLGVSIFPQISGSYGLRPVVAAPCPHVRVRGVPFLSFFLYSFSSFGAIRFLCLMVYDRVAALRLGFTWVSPRDWRVVSVGIPLVRSSRGPPFPCIYLGDPCWNALVGS
jgi:hypothetical protein